jgi:hypothetical protein
VRPRGETGAALFGVILLTALILSLGIFGARTSQIEVAIAGNDLQAKRALEIAEAGISHAFSLIKDKPVNGVNEAADGFNDELGGGGTDGALGSIGSTTTINGDMYRFRHFGGNASADGYYVRAIDNEDETNGLNDASADVDGRIHLISRGRAGKAERVIEAIIERDQAPQCVLCGARNFPLLPIDITLVGAISTDGFNSDAGPYAVGTATATGHIQSNGGISMSGLLQPVNIGGNVTASDNVVTLLGVNVTGAVTQNAPPVEYPSVAPCGPPYPPNDGITGGLYDQTLGTLVNVGVNDTIELEPGDYCFSSIIMAGASTLRVTGETRIYLTLPSTILGIVNTTNVASNLRVYSSVRSPIPPLPIVPGLVIAGAVAPSMVVYAPDAVLDFTGITNFYGSAVGAIIPNVGVAAMHYDQALQSPPVEMVGWRELRNYVPD